MKRALPAFIYALLLVFLVVALVSIDWGQLADLELSWGPLLLATVVSIAFRYLGVLIWLRLLHRLGATGLRGHYRELSYIYAKSWLGRYVPGAATWILGKIYFAGRHGVPRAKLAVSGVLEGALQIIATLLVGLTLVLVDTRAAEISPWIRWAMAGALIAGLVVLTPPVFRRVLHVAFRLLKRGAPDDEVIPRWGAMLEATGLYIIGALIAGASYYLVALAIYPELPLSDSLYVIGAASLSSAISMLAFFAPGGLGVREGTLALLLVAVVPAAVAVVLVVFLRVWSIAVDLLFFACAWGIRGARSSARATRA